MPDLFMSLIQTLVPALLVSLLTAYITVRLTLKRFYSERWWERKADTYSRIVESLHHMKKYLADTIDAEIEGIEFSKEKKGDIKKKWDDGADQISKITDIGSFIISNEAEKILTELNKRLEQARNQKTWFDYLDKQFGAVDNCLKEIKIIAKKDLKLKK